MVHAKNDGTYALPCNYSRVALHHIENKFRIVVNTLRDYERKNNRCDEFVKKAAFEIVGLLSRLVGTCTVIKFEAVKHVA